MRPMGVVNQEDLELIDKILDGDESHYKIIVEKYKSYVMTIAYGILKNHQEAEEAAQDTFIKAYQNLKKFNRQAKLTTWLYRIAFNTSITYQRKQKQGIKSMDDIPINQAKTINSNHQLEKKDKKKFIEKAIENLLPAYGTVINLFYMKELSMEEISKITGMRISAIKVKLHRARKRLARELTNILKEETSSLKYD